MIFDHCVLWILHSWIWFLVLVAAVESDDCKVRGIGFKILKLLGKNFCLIKLFIILQSDIIEHIERKFYFFFFIFSIFFNRNFSSELSYLPIKVAPKASAWSPTLDLYLFRGYERVPSHLFLDAHVQINLTDVRVYQVVTVKVDFSLSITCDIILELTWCVESFLLMLFIFAFYWNHCFSFYHRRNKD